MTAKPILLALSLATLSFLGGCTEKNPLSADGRGATGGLAPAILYKTGASQAGVAIPAQIAPLAVWMWIGVEPPGSGRIERTFSFANHAGRIDGIPVGRARVIISVRDSAHQDIYSGEEWVDIEANQTATPTLVADFVPPGKPDLTVVQTCDYGVRFSWHRCGLMNNIGIEVESLGLGGVWLKPYYNYMYLYEHEGEYAFNNATGQYEALDTATGMYAPGVTYRFRATSYFDTVLHASYYITGDSSAWSPAVTFVTGLGPCAGAPKGSVRVTFNTLTPSELKPLASEVEITISLPDSSRIERTFPFSDSQAVIGNVPEGAVRVVFAILDTNGDSLYKGESVIGVVAGQTQTPSIPGMFVRASAPSLSVVQYCDFGVKLSWYPCGLVNEVERILEEQSGSLWTAVDTASLVLGTGYSYNTNWSDFEAVDFSYAYASGVNYRIHIVPWYYSSDSGWMAGASSNTEPFILQPGYGACGTVSSSKFNLSGRVWGHVGTAHLKLFRKTTASPSWDALPMGTPVAEYTLFPPAYVGETFYFDSVVQDTYWLYAYSNTNAMDDWATSFKRAIYPVVLDREISEKAILLDFNASIFPNGKTLSAGNVTGGANNLNILELWYWNETDYKTYFLGFYPFGNMDTVEVWNFPSMSALAAYFGQTYDPSWDYFSFGFWNDANSSYWYDAGDRFYYDVGNDTWGIEQQDFIAPQFIGNLAYNNTAAKRAKAISGRF